MHGAREAAQGLQKARLALTMRSVLDAECIISAASLILHSLLAKAECIFLGPNGTM